MNRLLMLATAFLISITFCKAQSVTIAYTYDAAGNRIARNLVADPPQQSPHSLYGGRPAQWYKQ